MAHPLEIILLTNSPTFKPKHSPSHHIKRSYNLLQICQFRNQMVRWFYQAEKLLKYNRSTHYLTISVLDRLIISNFQFQEVSHEVLGATILLICSKFNEIYALPLKTLQYMPFMKENHSRDDFLEMQWKIFQKLQFNIVQEQGIYQHIASLQEKLRSSCKGEIEKLIQTAIKSPHLFRYGRNVLLKALQHLAKKTVAKAEHQCDKFFYQEVSQIMTELQELHSDCKKQNSKQTI